MSEQKVWVEKLPESCGDCEFCETSEHWFYCSRLGIKLKYISREKDCPLQSLKTHDRELVKEVCEKIRSELEKELKYDFTSYVPIMNVCNKINRVLDQTQKEYEK